MDAYGIMNKYLEFTRAKVPKYRERKSLRDNPRYNRVTMFYSRMCPLLEPEATGRDAG